MQLPNFSVMWAFMLGLLATQGKAYPSGVWPMYGQPSAREYPEEDYYYAPNVQYYYSGPSSRHAPEVYGRVPYYYDPYAHYSEEDPARQDERLASLPVGQETWFESETEPNWRANDLDDVNAAFLDNLILTQMAQDAQRRREMSRSALPSNDFSQRDAEDEEVRELKALAGKPIYHVPKTAPHYDDDDYQADDGFINWNGNKRSLTTAAPVPSTIRPRAGQDEVMVPQPPKPHRHHEDQTKKDSVYEKITQLLAAESKYAHDQKEVSKSRRIDKRFVAGDSDLVAELRGLKQRIAT